MRTVLLVGHGSRVAEGNDELRAFANLLARRRPELKFETCFIELAGPSIAKGIENCVQGGATAIYVVPIILFAAGHSKLDIPQAIDQAKARYPGVDFIYGRPIGVQDRAVEILLDRISEAVPVIPSKQPNPQKEVSVEKKVNIPDEETVVLLMGRGGSDPDANSDFCKLSRLLWEQTSYKSVESCFIAIAKPSLAAGLERCLLLGARKIIVLPYLLFTGVLIRQFNERVAAFAAEHPDIEVEIGSYLGAHPLLVEMLEERIDETLNGRSHANCDNCKYRTEAGVHHHHHGHDHHHENGCGHDHSHGHDHHHENGGGHGHNHGHDHHHENGCGHNHSHGHEHHHDEHDHTNGHSQCQGHYDFNHGSVHHRYCQMHSDDRERDHGPEHCNCAGDHQECPKEEQEVSGQLDRIGQPVSGSGTGSR
ncbi:sirohydrochlorin chelatase [Paenibacillus sp. GCM10012306]|uniref:sirohydrochlorin chelatase n=1 Tax=Paenibacillus sp. GCM10012306 TaxID=3317342 RepID=UPI00361C030D